MFDDILKNAKETIIACNDFPSLQQAKASLLGKSSQVNDEMQKLKDMGGEERKNFGIKLNKLKLEIEQHIKTHTIVLEEKAMHGLYEKEKLDLTLPAREYKQGSIHPISQCTQELLSIFSKYDFDIKEGPDIEDDWHNFTALGIGPDHPARQMHDTFYLNSHFKGTNPDGSVSDSPRVLRTHTSPVQIRGMAAAKPPFRFISPGRTYRSDSDQTHTPMFHQMEGLVVGEGINMSHMKYVIIDFIKLFFERDDIIFRFRPSFFPFTEPSAEVDIKMKAEDKWLEVLGCGMIHPSVLRNVGIDPEKYQGFAFGLGIERFAMLKYGINDLRKFFECDVKWLEHFSFFSFDYPTLAGGLTR